MDRKRLYLMLVSAMLIAIGLLIPLFSPVKLILEPASFTLASHVAIFIAMFVSPATAIAVAVGTTFGFLMAAYPPVIVFRAASHLVFALVGSLLLRKNPSILKKTLSMLVFAFLISLVHAVCELLSVLPFYFSTAQGGAADSSQVFWVSIVLLVGVGTLVHSLVDFFIARAIWVPLGKLNDRVLEHMSGQSPPL